LTIARTFDPCQNRGMSTTATDHRIESVEQLRAIYDQPLERVWAKEMHVFDAHCRAFIAASPFVLLGTYSEANGADCSPRGDFPGWVEVVDDTTLLLPDRRGNNRLDSLRNIVEHGAVGLLFLVPGVNETLRVNGRAHLSTDPELLARFTVGGKTPRSVIVVNMTEAFMQCARALVRSDLWNPEKRIDRAALPSMGTILEAHTNGAFDGKTYDCDAVELIPKTLY
jgi:PPOX class probable FMN-dependent enzyme